jgi:ABC-type sugar transport system ATPase subunit
VIETPTAEAPAQHDGADAIPIVEATGVSKRDGAMVALSDARLRVLPGESHALVGRNGAGKPTLIGILTGLRGPDSGEVRFRSEPAPAIRTAKGGASGSPASTSIRPSFRT